ncbi:MAG TPA: hypothetical protein VJ929_06860 [Roseovarius sp.]|nr:hypothetical protein [Roseovarius sp.]
MLHRQFIAAVLAAAVAVTGLTAAPARADNDAAKVIAGVAALAIIGAAVADANKSKRPKVIYQAPPAYGHQKHQARHKGYKAHKRHKAQSRHQRHNRHVQTHRGYWQGGAVSHRAQKRVALPNACLIANNGGRAVYSARCLERRGLR